MKLKDLFETSNTPTDRKRPPSATLKALRDPLFRQRVVKAKKGKGSYVRKEKIPSE